MWSSGVAAAKGHCDLMDTSHIKNDEGVTKDRVRALLADNMTKLDPQPNEAERDGLKTTTCPPLHFISKFLAA